MQTWKSGRKAFERSYFDGKRVDNKYTRYGKSMGELLTGMRKPDGMIEQDIYNNYKIDIAHKAEKELRSAYIYKKKKYNLLGFADVDTGESFEEHKTGTTESCYKDARDQMVFYDLIRKLGGLDPYLKGRIIWFKTTEVSPGKMEVAGDVKSIDCIWTEKHLEMMQNRLHKFINEVSIAYG